MYKIYVNDTPLLLLAESEAPPGGRLDEKNLRLRYAGKKKLLLNVIHQLEKSGRFESVAVFSDDLEKMWADFRSLYRLVEAAGGAVFNEKNEALLIFRRDNWDLPKGKIDPGETPAEAALREVREETGLKKLVPGAPLAETWHTYEEKKQRILKRTHWFLMKTSDLELTPQTEEDIEQAVWTNLNQFLRQPPGKVYGSILDVLELALERTFTTKMSEP